MKMAKRIFTLVLALAMIAAMMVMPAMADETTYTLTINHISANHTFNAYQLFKGDLADGVLSNIEWGDGVKGAELLAALKADTTEIKNSDGSITTSMSILFKDCTTAAQVAEVLQDFTTDGDRLERFAKVAAQYLDVVAGTANTSTLNGNKYEYKIEGLEAGYYIVVDNTAESDVGAEDYKTHYILSIVSDVTVDTKGSYTIVDKTVSETLDGTYTDYIADQLNTTHYFKIDVELADDLGEYDEYFLGIYDTMSVGLKYLNLEEVYVLESNNNKVYLYQGGVWTTGATPDVFTVVENADGTTDLTIEWNDLFKVYSAIAGDDEIVVKFASKLTEDAIVGGANPNEVDIKFTNGPSSDDYGYSVPDYAYVFPFGLRVLKVDNDNNTILLPGAQFTLYHLHGTEKHYAVVDENGKIMEWTPYATQADIDADETLTDEQKAEMKAASVLVTDENGTFAVDGLDEEIMYYLHEVEAPAGYNTMFTDVKFSIHPTYATNADGVPYVASITYNVDGHENTINTGDDFNAGRVVVTVKNDKGNTLPSTGGVGTTMFYIFGGLMVVGAAVLLITKKRMAY